MVREGPLGDFEYGLLVGITLLVRSTGHLK
jgi:hypothetical protein